MKKMKILLRNNVKKIKQFFNIFTKEENKIIAEQCDKMRKMANDFSLKYNNEDRITQKNRDSKCPNCRASEIVNKITRVEGSGYVSGSFILGGGSVYGSSTTDTNEVNHCNKCGNQWKKYERKYKWEESILVDWINDLDSVYDGKYTYGYKTVVLLKDFYAESIYQIAKQVFPKCYSSAKENLTLDYLRTKFKSIYQEGNK